MANLFGMDLSWVKEWQTLVGSIVGFSGVALTIWLSGRKDRNLLKLKDQGERDSLLASISAELDRFRDDFTSMLQYAEEHDCHVIPKHLDEPVIYKANLGRVGLVGKDAAQAIIQAYRYIKRYDQYLANTIEDALKDGRIGSAGDEYYAVPPKIFVILKPLILLFLGEIDRAIQVINEQLNPKPLRSRMWGRLRAVTNREVG
ncbi:MAG TPA: hypothetical protein VHL31_10810 [Geminicoccus sp.]|uniref:hypothetical protein n=1 Tax=Geminicoccus sp. TaxID=2024832 RepID=UPI002E35D0FF|nr:hypothetical protein [Geminicoccus sp.]HEX2526770.1 hypothetical protein [Geminicoccus sp.]